jgi:hypothetical protein
MIPSLHTYLDHTCRSTASPARPAPWGMSIGVSINSSTGSHRFPSPVPHGHHGSTMGYAEQTGATQGFHNMAVQATGQTLTGEVQFGFG